MTTPISSPSQATTTPHLPHARAVGQSTDDTSQTEGTPVSAYEGSSVPADSMWPPINSRAWHLTPPRVRAQTRRLGFEAFEDGGAAAMWLGLGALSHASAASLMTDAIVRRDKVEFGWGLLTLLVGLLDNMSCEAKTRALAQDLGDVAPAGLVGPHTLTQLGFLTGGALYTWGSLQGAQAVTWSGMALLAVSWLGTSIQLNRLIDAIETPTVRLGEESWAQPHSERDHHTTDIVGNPWAVMLMVLGSHGMGEAIRADNGQAALIGLGAALLGLEVAHKSRQHDSLFWLALSGVAAGALGYTLGADAALVRLGAGLALGIGVVHNLYSPAQRPQLRAQARRRLCPTLMPAF